MCFLPPRCPQGHGVLQWVAWPGTLPGRAPCQPHPAPSLDLVLEVPWFSAPEGRWGASLQSGVGARCLCPPGCCSQLSGVVFASAECLVLSPLHAIWLLGDSVAETDCICGFRREHLTFLSVGSESAALGLLEGRGGTRGSQISKRRWRVCSSCAWVSVLRLLNRIHL